MRLDATVFRGIFTGVHSSAAQQARHSDCSTSPGSISLSCGSSGRVYQPERVPLLIAQNERTPEMNVLRASTPMSPDHLNRLELGLSPPGRASISPGNGLSLPLSTLCTSTLRWDRQAQLVLTVPARAPRRSLVCSASPSSASLSAHQHDPTPGETPPTTAACRIPCAPCSTLPAQRCAGRAA